MYVPVTSAILDGPRASDNQPVSTTGGPYLLCILCTPPAQTTTRQKNAEGSSANELVLRLFGVAKTRVMYDTTNMAHSGNNAQSYTHREMLTEKKEFLSYDVQLAAFGGKAASGSHNFPFSVMLPPGLPPSMKVQNRCCICRWLFFFTFSKRA